MKSFFLYRFEESDVTGDHETLVVFAASQKFDPEEFDIVVQREIDRNLWPDEILLIVRETAFHAVRDQMSQSPRIESLVARFPRNLPIVLSGFGPYGGEQRRETIYGEKRPRQVAYSDFTNRALTHIFRERGGFVESTDAFHFENPSKRHARRFMRLSNVLVRGAEVSFFAFALLPMLPLGAEVAYVDTPSLFGLIGAINEHWSELEVKHRLSADSFGSHGGLQNYRFTRSDNCIVLISASSSGGLADKINHIEPLISTDRIVHCVFLGVTASKYKICCDLAYSENSNPEGYRISEEDFHAGNCELCALGSVPIPLVGDQFDIAGPQPSSVLVGIADAPPTLGLTMGHVVGTRALRVGLGRPREGALPRQFEIDAPSLMSSTAFMERAKYVRSRSIPADVAATVMLDALSRPFAEFLTPRVQPIDRDKLRSLDRSEGRTPVVIAAIAIESGRSLLDVSRDLRATFPHAPQIYIVGFSKTTSDDELKRLKATLVRTAEPQQHEFAVVESLTLPSSGQSTPWTRELELLDRVLNLALDISGIDEKVLQFFRERRDRLAARPDALVDELFVGNRVGQKLSLQHGFVFWPPELPATPNSQADVFYTVASVLQALRSVSKPGAKALRASGLQHTILDPHNFGRFNDGIIQASLLRAASPAELNYASSERDSNEMLRISRRILESSDRPRGEAAAEFLLALAIGRINLRVNDYPTLLAPVPNAPPIVGALMEICRQIKISATAA